MNSRATTPGKHYWHSAAAACGRVRPGISGLVRMHWVRLKPVAIFVSGFDCESRAPTTLISMK